MSYSLNTVNSLQIDQFLNLIMRDENQVSDGEVSVEVPLPRPQPEQMEAEPSSFENQAKEDSEYVGRPRNTPKGKKVQKTKKNGNLVSLPQTAPKGKRGRHKRLTEVQKLQGKSSSQDCFHLEDESSKGSLTSLDGILDKSCSLPYQLKEALIKEKKNIENTLATTHCLSSGETPQALPSIHYQTLSFKKYHYTAHFWVVQHSQAQKENIVLSRTRNREKIEPFEVWARQTFQKEDMEVYFNNALSRLNCPRLFKMIMELASIQELTTKDKFDQPIISHDKKANFSHRSPVWSPQELLELRMKKRAELEKRRYIQVEEYVEMGKVE